MYQRNELAEFSSQIYILELAQFSKCFYIKFVPERSLHFPDVICVTNSIVLANCKINGLKYNKMFISNEKFVSTVSKKMRFVCVNIELYSGDKNLASF